MDNQVNIGCFSPVSAHFELLTIWKLLLCLLYENQ